MTVTEILQETFIQLLSELGGLLGLSIQYCCGHNVQNSNVVYASQTEPNNE